MQAEEAAPGRLLVALMLHERGQLKKPLLYLSLYLKQNRLEYYDRLTAVRRKGDWEGWLKFFLKGVTIVAEEAFSTAQRVATFREEALGRARALGRTETALIDLLFERPIMDIRTAERLLPDGGRWRTTGFVPRDSRGEWPLLARRHQVRISRKETPCRGVQIKSRRAAVQYPEIRQPS
jgi:hypothetical protein